MTPIRCISSHLTTEVLKFRNPQGTEENWFENREEDIDYTTQFPKIIVTELATAALFLTATVETVVYGILFLSSLPVSLWSTKPMNYCGNLLNSSTFTIVWNLGNITVLNPFCKNALTHESLARYTMDNWPRGAVSRAILPCIGEIYCIYTVVSSILIPQTIITNFIIFPSLEVITGLFLAFIKYTRSVDDDYITTWSADHNIRIINEAPIRLENNEAPIRLENNEAPIRLENGQDRIHAGNYGSSHTANYRSYHASTSTSYQTANAAINFHSLSSSHI